MNHSKKLKILIVSDTFLPQIGGAEIHVRDLARFLKEEGHEPVIFTNTEGENDFLGIRVIRNDRFGSRIFRFFRDFKKLIGLMGDFDVIHGHYTFYLSSVAFLAAKILRKPTVVTLHGMGTLDSSVNKKFRRRIYRWFSFKSADMVIATSGEMSDVARRFVDKKKVRIITNGVDSEAFATNPRTDENINVLTMRRLNPKNGVQYLIEAAPFIIGKNNKINFLIAGKDRLENHLKNRVKELGVESHFDFIGEVLPENVLSYYEKSDIVAFPSSAESTSIACLEAMASGRTVVASALSAFKEMLGNNERGFLVKLFDREESDYEAPLTLPKDRLENLSEAILTLAENKSKREELGRAAKKFVRENYDWRVLTKKIVEIYDYLMK